MNNLVEFSFTMIAYAIIAFIFYSIFFGFSFGGDSLITDFDGLLYYICRASENSMGYLYYEYVYEPTVHKTDGIDLQVLENCGVSGSYTANVVSQTIDSSGGTTKSDLSNGERDSFANINFPSGDKDGKYYTSGWH